MNSATDLPGSLAAKASWAAFGLALGGVGGCLILQLLNQFVPFETSERGLLVGTVVLWPIVGHIVLGF